MINSQKLLVFAAIIALIGGLAVAPAAANHLDGVDRDDDSSGADQEDSSDDEEDDEEDSAPVVEIDLEGVTDAIEDLADDFDEFTDGWTDDLADVLKQVLFKPFQELAKVLVDVLTHIFTSYPDVQGNSDVQEMHSLSLKIAFGAGSLVIAAAGILYMTGPIFGIGYAQVRTLLPRIIVALIFGTVSTTLLQYSVDMAEAATYAFQPANPNFTSTLRLSGELVLVAVLKSVLLLGLIFVFLIRDVYIMFAAALAPVIALGWSFPYAKRYADSMIGSYWAALLIGPVNMVLFRLTLSLLETDGFEAPHWLYALAGITLMIWMPYQLFSASQAAGNGFRRIMSGAEQKVRNEKRRQTQQKRPDYDGWRQGEPRPQHRSNNSDYLWSGDDD